MIDVIDGLDGLCADCEHRFRRVFTPHDPMDFEDEDGNPIEYLDADEFIILDVCLLTDIPMGKDITYDCTHFTPREDKDEEDSRINLFKHLK